MFRRVQIFCAAILAGVTPHFVPVRAFADSGSPVASGYAWSGFYAGVSGGYAWATAEFDINTDPVIGNVLNPAGRATFADLGSGSGDLDGLIGGVQAGYNYQSGIWVFGLEADLNGLSEDVSRTAERAANIPATFRDEAKIDWLATVRARLGVSSGMALFYVTGGLAIADVSFSRRIFVPGDGCPTTPCHSARDSDTLTGWTVGAGGEYALTSNWSLKAEYLFVDLSGDLDDTTESRLITGQFLTQSADIDDLHIIRAGLNYRF